MPSAPHIFTFTGNPLAETTMDFADWAPGLTQRAVAASFQMGGKGINVAKMLLRLGAPVTALTFLGGESGDQCSAWLKKRGIPFTSFFTRAPVRSGVVIRSPGKPETTFLGPDAPPDAAAWNSAVSKLAQLMNERTAFLPTLALCGSIPGWASESAEPFRATLKRWLSAGLPLVVDCYGPPLSGLSVWPVDLVKINAQEFATLLGPDARASTAENLRLAKERWPVKAWIISDGPKPIWYCDGETLPACLTPPAIKEISTTGSGDVLLACILFARTTRHCTLREALDFAVPLAAANAAHPGIAEFPMP